ncbi:DUF742 domain-containing protein [Streptomyces sp. NPDC088725]|uniref:DUF742 domain-containing protein n=1 Tax=Streptomyces sp. NPDC088725 TaxID=3365873 RepID=UPI003826276B
MTSFGNERRQRPAVDAGRPERLYVITGGRGGARRAHLDLVTMIVARHEPSPRVRPEQAAILRLCGAPLSVAEISARLGLPPSGVTSLLTELLGAGAVEARAPVARADRSLLEAVMHGLRRL